MKKYNKLLSLLLFILLLAACTAATIAAEDTVHSGTWYTLTWELNETTGELIISGQGDLYGFSLSDNTHAWKPYQSSIKKVVISDGVLTIGKYAFYNCNNLTELTLGSDVTTIYDSAFQYCSALKIVTMNDGLTSMANSAFSYCSALTDIVLPDTLTAINSYTFSGCTSLENVTFGKGITRIDSDAFASCHKFAKLVLPANVAEIHERAFYDCTGLESIEVDAESPYYYSEGNCLIQKESQTLVLGCSNSVLPTKNIKEIGNFAFYNCSGLTEITIPSGVTKIGNTAFIGCSGLKSIVIPEGVTSIGSFSNCSSLESIILPNTVTTIGSFERCSKLKSIVIPDGVTSITIWAFQYCSSLTSIHLPKSIVSIDESAFVGCSSLTEVHITDLEAWMNISFYKATSNPLYYSHALYLNGTPITEIVVPETVTRIKDFVFAGGSQLTSVQLHDGVTEIGEGAFLNCSSLTEIKLPKNLTAIGESAFFSCKALTALTIPDSVTSIEIKAFYQCESLTSIAIPKSVTAISSYTFSYCDNLEELILPGSITQIGGSAFWACPKLTRITYCGTKDMWNAIKINTQNNSCLTLKNVTFHRYSYTILNEVHQQVCSLCDEVIEQTHAYSAWTKQNADQHIKTCLCGHNVITNHSWNNGKITLYPSHISTGVKTYTCTDCGDKKTEVVDKIAAHNYGDWQKMDDTYHQRSCQCGDKPIEEHTWNSGAVPIPSTHTQEGLMVYTCTTCKATKEVVLPKRSEHEHSMWQPYSDSQHKKLCPCGDEMLADHIWNDGQITAEPTVDAEGVKTFSCADCNEIRTEALPKLPAPEISEATEAITNAPATTTATLSTAPASSTTAVPQTEDMQGGCASALLGTVGVTLIACGATLVLARKKRR